MKPPHLPNDASDALSKPASLRRRGPSGRWLTSVFLVLFALQIALYRDSFQVGPSGDDFGPPLSDIPLVETEGPWMLFIKSSHHMSYRPLQSLVVWAFASISQEHRQFWIHVTTFVGMAVFAFAAACWFRAMPVSRIGALCGAIALFVHPVLVSGLGGFDGHATLYSTGLMWLATYVIYAGRRRLGTALPASLLIFIVAMGFKEYSLGTVPLACMVMLCFSDSIAQGIRRAFVVGATFSVVVIGFIILRHYTIPPHPRGLPTGFVVFDPLTWARNAAQFIGVMLFPGSSKWVFLNRTPAVMLTTGVAILGVAITLMVGLWWRWRGQRSTTRTGRSESALPDQTDGARQESARWIIFGVMGLAGASFPAVLIGHVSEMYAVGMLVALSMLIALAADGYAMMRRGARLAAALIFAVAVVWAALAVRSKIDALRNMSARARQHLEQVLAFIPHDAHGLTIAICYPPESGQMPKYSVFQYPDDMLIAQPWSLLWLRPHSRLRVEFPMPTLEDALARSSKFALIVQWNPATQRMEVVHSNLPVR